MACTVDPNAVKYDECRTCLNLAKRKLKIPNNCGTCSKSEGLNWEENPIAMIDILDAQIAELHKAVTSAKKKQTS